MSLAGFPKQKSTFQGPCLPASLKIALIFPIMLSTVPATRRGGANALAFRMRPKQGALRSVDLGFAFCVFPNKKTSNVGECSGLKGRVGNQENLLVASGETTSAFRMEETCAESGWRPGGYRYLVSLSELMKTEMGGVAEDE